MMHETPMGSDQKAAEIEAAWAAHRATASLNPRRPWLERHYANQDGKCAYCGVVMDVSPTGPTERRATIDHVIPRARGGPDVEENTLAACLLCNRDKADMPLSQFLSHPSRRRRFDEVNSPPDRLAVDSKSPFRCEESLERGVRVFFRDRERTDVEEYCVSEGWIAVPAGKALDRKGRPITVKLKGVVKVAFEDAQQECYAESIIAGSQGQLGAVPG